MGASIEGASANEGVSVSSLLACSDPMSHSGGAGRIAFTAVNAATAATAAAHLLYAITLAGGDEIVKCCPRRQWEK